MTTGAVRPPDNRPPDATPVAAPARIQRKRTKGWRMPEGAVYVGRPGRWGNPFGFTWLDLHEQIDLYRLAVQGIWKTSNVAHLSDAELQATYAAWNEWRKRLGSGHPTEIAQSELRGRDLACWCPVGQPCHADVLLELVNDATEERR